MSITPRGMPISEAYRLYRSQKLLVNRRYQRKLVWTQAEKVKLLDSILKGYPIPLILLASRSQIHKSGVYEIMDGMQRFNAIFTFIENFFPLDDDRYFDIQHFSYAKELLETGVIEELDGEKKLLSLAECAKIIDYQLAVTIYPATTEEEITDVFGRINSNGKQLSFQEKRQAGVVAPFADTVRKIASELRGDSSKELMLLVNMPEISIDSKQRHHGYGLNAEDILWCKQGILTVSQLRDSEDEQMIADICASILLGEPLAYSRERLDKLYDLSTAEFKNLENALARYTSDRLLYDIKATFSVLREVIETYSDQSNILRRVVHPNAGGNPIKTAFYAIFMAFFDLIVHQERTPIDPQGIMEALNNVHTSLKQTSKAVNVRDRKNNINKVKGLVDEFFVKKEPSILRHGPSLALDLENSIRRSLIETSRYECKQGLLRLSNERDLDQDLLQRILQTICGIANVGPDGDGYLFVGVADNKKDAERVKVLDQIEPYEINGRYIVGIDREAKSLSVSIEQYIDILLNSIRNSGLSEPVKTQVLTKFDTVKIAKAHQVFSVVRITIPAQTGISYVGDDAFYRNGSSTELAKGKKIMSVHELFNRS
ncbi:GmrSD restriction endonuclease domain-containing protein [Nodosilinea nodulosa]|uniref:GmrSD restriction endonuclease domain-containing protein n=1 Tax=Nodosilinea nodulosa TaxID=416001 RepID=UPI0002D46E07|nr:DUF262 domain-containing protein [Nodosilinea nodulosa]